jgi:hypothetical protein
MDTGEETIIDPLGVMDSEATATVEPHPVAQEEKFSSGTWTMFGILVLLLLFYVLHDLRVIYRRKKRARQRVRDRLSSSTSTSESSASTTISVSTSSSSSASVSSSSKTREPTWYWRVWWTVQHVLALDRLSWWIQNRKQADEVYCDRCNMRFLRGERRHTVNGDTHCQRCFDEMWRQEASPGRLGISAEAAAEGMRTLAAVAEQQADPAGLHLREGRLPLADGRVVRVTDSEGNPVDLRGATYSLGGIADEAIHINLTNGDTVIHRITPSEPREGFNLTCSRCGVTLPSNTPTATIDGLRFCASCDAIQRGEQVDVSPDALRRMVVVCEICQYRSSVPDTVGTWSCPSCTRGQMFPQGEEQGRKIKAECQKCGGETRIAESSILKYMKANWYCATNSCGGLLLFPDDPELMKRLREAKGLATKPMRVIRFRRDHDNDQEVEPEAQNAEGVSSANASVNVTDQRERSSKTGLRGGTRRQQTTGPR